MITSKPIHVVVTEVSEFMHRLVVWIQSGGRKVVKTFVPFCSPVIDSVVIRDRSCLDLEINKLPVLTTLY